MFPHTLCNPSINQSINQTFLGGLRHVLQLSRSTTSPVQPSRHAVVMLAASTCCFGVVDGHSPARPHILLKTRRESWYHDLDIALSATAGKYAEYEHRKSLTLPYYRHLLGGGSTQKVKRHSSINSTPWNKEFNVER